MPAEIGRKKRLYKCKSTGDRHCTASLFTLPPVDCKMGTEIVIVVTRIR